MNMKKILLLAVIVCSTVFASSQVVQLGSGTAINSITTASPVNTYWRRQVLQIVYTAAEINAAGANGANTLSQLGFYITNQPLYAIPGYTIKIKNTTQTNVATSLGTTGWTTVKNAFTYTPTAGGYDMIIFDVPFNWDGVSNIGIEICWSQVQPNWDASGQCRIYNVNNGYRYSWNDNAGSICGTVPATISNNKPQVQLAFKTTSTWSGSVSSDWFNAANWDAGVPDYKMNALIPTSAASMPVISGVGAVCKNLTINASASLTLVGSSNIDIYKDWINNGTFIANTGTVTLKGTAINNINGALNQDLYNLTIDNVNGAAIVSGSINLHGTLNVGVATGNFNTNNALTIVSDANGTGRIGQLTTKCKYTLNMSDAYGDGWNGGYLTVLINGVTVGTYFAKGSNSTANFIAGVGSTVQLNYTPGSYENENTYSLIDGGGATIFSDGPTPATGTNVFSTVANCSFFNPITGNITMQRYINAGATNWRFLTSAVAGSTIAGWNDNFITSGFIGSDFPNWPTAANPWPSIYFYDETKPGIQDSGFVAATNVTNPIAVGQGVWVWSGDTITGTQPFMIDVTGPPNVGDISLPLSYTNTGFPAADGYSMVGNPYPSTLDWDSPNITKIGVNNAIYIWNPDLQQFASYVFGLGVNGGSRYIASSQAFWIKASAVGASVVVTEASKSAVDASFLKQSQTSNPFKMKVINNYGSDELIINFNENATNGFDASFDAIKMASVNTNIPAISSVLDSIDYSINQLPEQEINIPIKILSGAGGIHTVNFQNISAFVNSSCIILEDLFTGSTYDLRTTNSITVYINSTTTSARFLLHLGAPKYINKTNASCFTKTDGAITFRKNTTNTYNIVWKNSSNNVVASRNNVSLADSISNINADTYFIETTDLTCGSSIDTVVISSPLPITTLFSVANDTVYLTNGGNVSFTNQSINANSYLWDFGDGFNDNIISPTHTYNQSGTFLVSLTASQTANCYNTYTKNITVLGIATSISELNTNQNVKVWIHEGVLNINLANKIYNKIEIRNILGQLLYTKNNPTKDIMSVNIGKVRGNVLVLSLIGQQRVDVIKLPITK